MIPTPRLPHFSVIIASLLLAMSCASPLTIDRTVSSRYGVAVCVDDLAVRVGASILANGGNAVDAAVAMGFALAVTHPQAGNLGGGGFMVIRLPDSRCTCIDYRERAPAASTTTMFLAADGTIDTTQRDLGFLATATPGTVAGLELAHRRYGRLPWRILVEPAIELARAGFTVDDDLARSLAKHGDDLARFPTTKKIFFDASTGRPLAQGDRLVQPDLAATLTSIRDRGSAGLYRGTVAEELIRSIQTGGGIMTLDDLASYRALEKEPLMGFFRGHTIVAMPLPSSGGTVLIEILNMLSAYDLKALDRAERLHIMAEAMRRAFRDRALFLGDDEFVPVPVNSLLTPERAAELIDTIDPDRATDSQVLARDMTIHASELSEQNENEPAFPTQTTHFAVMDHAGIMVSNTYTLEQTFGCKAVAGATGMLMNNEMGDFNLRPGWTADDGKIGTSPNIIAPRKRMLSSMCPVILLRQGKPCAILGSPGGRTIINTVLQVLVNLVVLELPPEEAVAAPRIHHQWFPDRITLEKKLDGAIKQELQARGHRIKEIERQGDAHLIVVDELSGVMTGVADRRIDGFAAGLD